MFDYFTHGLVTGLIVFQTVILVVMLSNMIILRRARRHAPPGEYPMVSVLVPARNEEKNIGRCISSLLAQDYPVFEVLVLDDQSSDDTHRILEKIASNQSKLKVLTGSTPPAGQVGKNWACMQLAQAAQGELLFFTDADTFHQPHTLRLMVTALTGERADLLTGFPRQEIQSWGERLLVPFFTWAFLCFEPLWLAYRLRLAVLSNAVGQMMLFRKAAYRAIGGHGSVGSEIVDDIMLAGKIKSAGLRWRVVHVTDLISCRMYRGSREAFEGFSKNYFAAFGYRLLVYLFVFLWLGVTFWEPLIVLMLMILRLIPLVHLDLLAACIGLELLVWLIPYIEMGLPVGLGLIYPVTILANDVAAANSLRLSLTGRLTWKGRPLARPKWKWL